MAKKGNTRTTGLEQYYTPQAAADALVQLVLDNTDATSDDQWLEPAAGAGSFSRAIRRVGVKKLLSMDIDPKKRYIQSRDFLTETLTFQNAICVTNPPFGRNHSLSIPFFNHAADHCRVIAFVVPRSWRKWSIVNRLNRRFHKVLDIDLTLSYEDENGKKLTKSSSLNTVFQIWVRRDDDRPRFPESNTTHVAVVAPEEANVSLTVFGRGCGTTKTSFKPVPNTTQMFMRVSKKVLSALSKVDLSPFFTQVAYTEALSIVEINFAIDNWLKTKTNLPANFLRDSTLEI